MDKNPLISRLNKTVPGAVLEVRRFGRSPISSIWVETQSIQRLGEALKSDPECKFDWLENLSVVEFEGVFVITYFLRSTVTQHTVVLRLSAVLASPTSEVVIPSVWKIWPMAVPMEKDAQEMFGVVFKAPQGSTTVEDSDAKIKILPEGWDGFPLRKNYVFPKEFINIPHSRPVVNRAIPKKTIQ